MSQTFRKAWEETIGPRIDAKFQWFQAQKPISGKEQIGQPFGETALKKLTEIGEVRNVTANLAWTHPLALSVLAADLSLALVKKFVKDHWEKRGQPGKYEIPQIVPTAWTIPIACFSKEVLPAKGEFKRLEMDLAAVAPWYVLADLIRDAELGLEESHGQLVKLELLILNWPIDLILFASESLVLARAVQIRDENETAREYFGLDGPSLLSIVDQTEQVLKTIGSGKHSPKEIVAYLDEHVKWSEQGKRAPKVHTVQGYQTILHRSRSAPVVRVLLEELRCEYGRDTIWDELSKFLIVVQKTTSRDFEFVVKGLSADIVSTKNENPAEKKTCRVKAAT